VHVTKLLEYEARVPGWFSRLPTSVILQVFLLDRVAVVNIDLRKNSKANLQGSGEGIRRGERRERILFMTAPKREVI